MHMGGVGLRSASRSSHAAYWSGWADCLATIRARHVNVADTMAAALSDPPVSATHLVGVAHSRDLLTDAGLRVLTGLLCCSDSSLPNSQRDPCTPAWVVVLCRSVDGGSFQGGCRVAAPLSHRAGAGPFTIWGNGWFAILVHPIVQPLCFHS